MTCYAVCTKNTCIEGDNEAHAITRYHTMKSKYPDSYMTRDGTPWEPPGYQVVMFYGDECNDYLECSFDDKGKANLYLMANGYGFSSTFGQEDVFYNADGHIASISPEGQA